MCISSLTWSSFFCPVVPFDRVTRECTAREKHTALLRIECYIYFNTRNVFPL